MVNKLAHLFYKGKEILSCFTLTLLLSLEGRGNSLLPRRRALPHVIASEANAERGNPHPQQPREIASADQVSLAMTKK